MAVARQFGDATLSATANCHAVSPDEAPGSGGSPSADFLTLAATATATATATGQLITWP